MCSNRVYHNPGGSHIDMVYVYVPAFWGGFFAKFGIAIGWFHQRRRSPNYINWVYLGQITYDFGESNPPPDHNGNCLSNLLLLMLQIICILLQF